MRFLTDEDYNGPMVNDTSQIKAASSSNRDYEAHLKLKTSDMSKEWHLAYMAIEVLKSGSELGHTLEKGIRFFYDVLVFEKKIEEHRRKHKELLDLVEKKGLPDNVLEFKKMIEMLDIDIDLYAENKEMINE